MMMKLENRFAFQVDDQDVCLMKLENRFAQYEGQNYLLCINILLIYFLLANEFHPGSRVERGDVNLTAGACYRDTSPDGSETVYVKFSCAAARLE